MSRIVGKRISRSQLEKMADFLEKYPQLSKGSSSEKSVQHGYKEKLWRQLAEILNSEPLGAKKSSLKWRKCLRDYKCSVKKKYLHYLADSSNLSPLTYLDVRYLAMMGYVVDMERMELANKDDEQPYLENTGNLVTEDIVQKKEPEQKFYQAPQIITILPKNYAPTTVDQFPADQSVVCVKQDAHETVVRPSIKLLPNVKTPSIKLLPNVETPSIKLLPNVETPSIKLLPNVKTPSIKLLPNVKRPSIKLLPNIEISKSNELSIFEIDQDNEPSKVEKPKKYEPSVEEFTISENTIASPQTSPKKKLSLDKTSGVQAKNETAVALHAIATELKAKNELTKNKIELDKERLQLEKRKIEALELIAKRLRRK